MYAYLRQDIGFPFVLNREADNGLEVSFAEKIGMSPTVVYVVRDDVQVIK